MEEHPARHVNSALPPVLRLIVSNGPRIRGALPVPEVRRVIRMTLRTARIQQPVRVWVSWVRDEEMRRLNRRTRGKNRTTDVLSFAFAASAFWPEKIRDLGDMVIAPETARREAVRRRCTYREECMLLLAHGTLHLLGFDHAVRAPRARMFRLQNRIMRKLGAPSLALPLMGDP